MKEEIIVVIGCQIIDKILDIYLLFCNKHKMKKDFILCSEGGPSMKSIKRGRMGVLFAENKGVSNRSHRTLFSMFLGFILVYSVAFPLPVAWAAAPTAPTNLTTTAASSRQINLTWQDNATNEANYYIEHAPT